LGSIYEGILEYHAEIADQEKVVIKRGTSGKSAEEYVNVSELKAEDRPHLKTYRQALKDDEENPSPPRGCKVTGLIEPGEYYLIYGGRESKRKSSGSYYTPDYIVQYIVENTLGPLVRGECRSKPGPVPELLKGKPGFEEESNDIRPLSSDEILELKVLDPAMGSGHFLVAATEYLAREYGAACIREGKDKDGVMSDDEFVHYKRILAERCIYGVDINPMAVELSKLSMWLFTMDKGRPLSFLDHHLKAGNALIGAWIEHLGQPPEFDTKGKPKKRKDNKTGNLFELRFRERAPLMVSDLFGIMDRETQTIVDVQLKKTLDRTVKDLKQPFKNLADSFVDIFFGEEITDYNSLLLSVENARGRESTLANQHRYFHWELEFPEVFFDRHGQRLVPTGFDVIFGNPPYVRETGNKQQFQFLAKSPAWSNEYRDKSDVYYYFILLARHLLRKHGRAAFIVPTAWMTATRAEGLRKVLSADLRPVLLTHFQSLRVFESDIDSVIVEYGIRTKPIPLRWRCLLVEDALRSKNIDPSLTNLSHALLQQLEPFAQYKEESGLPGTVWSIGPAEIDETFDRLLAECNPLNEIARIVEGVQTGADEVTSQNIKYAGQASLGQGIFSLSDEELAALKLPNDELAYIRRFVPGGDFMRYRSSSAFSQVRNLVYLRKGINPSSIPHLLSHLSRFRSILAARAEIRRNPRRAWWEILWPRDAAVMLAKTKMIHTKSSSSPRNRFCVDTGGHVFGSTINVITVENPIWCVYALQALLNSKVIDLYYETRGKRKSATLRQYYPAPMGQIPIPKVQDTGADYLDTELVEGVLRGEISSQKGARLITDSWQDQTGERCFCPRVAIKYFAHCAKILNKLPPADLGFRRVDDLVEILVATAYGLPQDEREDVWRAWNEKTGKGKVGN
jgi:hypothetical protein